MGKREVRQPGGRAGAVLHDREHAFRSDVVDHVEVVIALCNDARFGVTGCGIHHILHLRRVLLQHADRGALPVVAELPDCPVAALVVAIEHIGRERDGRIVVERQRIFDFLEDVLWHDPGSVPAHGEQRMEPRIRRLEVENYRVAVGLLHAVDVQCERRAPPHAGMVDLGLDRIGQVVGGEFYAVAPVHAFAQFHRHGSEVVIVDWRLGCQRIGPRVSAAFRIDPPQRVGRQLLLTVDTGTTPGRPQVEPIGVLRGWTLDDQCFVARNTRDEILADSRQSQQ